MTTPHDEPVGPPERSGADGLVAARPGGGGPGAAGGPDRGRAPTSAAVDPAADPDGRAATVRLRLDVAYDGTEFHGWARQPGLRCVQGELEAALRAVLRIGDSTPVRVAVAGRTDAGVHATGQVCHADVPAVAWAGAAGGRAEETTAEVVGRRCAGLLPHDLRVRRIREAPPGFDARWSALWRSYRYRVADDPAAQDPRTRGQVLWNARALDVAAMHDAAAPFVGEHDFAAFCRSRPGASSVRTLQQIHWARVAAPDLPDGPGLAELTVRSDAFCHSMIRSLVGAFLAVGERRWPVQRPAELLAAAVRDPAIASAPAHGLTLVEVGYPADPELGPQAIRARRWRGR